MNTKQKAAIAILALTLTSGAGYLVVANDVFTPDKNIKRDSSGDQNVDGSSEKETSEEPNNSKVPISSATELPKPMLSKSSGNVAPINSGVVVQFTCEGTPDTSCKVLLVNENNSDEIVLSAKQISDNGRGQAFVSWEWEAVEGTWKVTAILSKDGFKSVSSDEQRLTVQ